MTTSPKFFFASEEYFSALLLAIESAQIKIDLEMYIFASDGVGRRFAELLAKKAQLGVQVRVMYDSIGSQWTDAQLWSLLEENGVQLREYNPTFPFLKNLRRRNHRKVLIVDGRVGFLGGFNLMDVAWRDTGVALEKPKLVEELQRIFNLSWNHRELKLRNLSRRKWKRPRWRETGQHVVPSYGGKRLSWIRQEYFAAVIRAQRRMWITNPYFIPDLGIIRALKKAARRGVDVRILTAGISDVAVARWAGRAVYARLLNAGVRIFEYQPAVLHAKSAVMDEKWFTVGTANIDHLSLVHNLEVNLFGTDGDAAVLLAQQFEVDLAASKEISPQDWKHRPAMEKFLEQLCYFFRSWL